MSEQYSVAPPPPPDSPGYAVEQVQTVEASSAERAGLEEAVQADLSPDQLRELARATYVETWGRFDGAYGPERDQQICDILCQHQAEQRANGQVDFDVFKIKPRAAFVVQRLLTEATEDETEADQVEEAKQKSTETASYRDLQTQLEQDEAWANKSPQEKIATILEHPAVPEAQKTKLQAFQQILTIAAANEADSAVVTAAVAQIDLFNPPEPTSFARAFLFDAPGQPSGLSTATQAAIATELGITLKGVTPPRNASEAQVALREGRGTEQITETQRVEEPPGSGNYVEKEVVVEERPLPFTEADPLLISTDPLVEVFPDPPGSQHHIVRAYVTGSAPSRLGLHIPEHGSLPESDINNFVTSQQTQALLASRGYAGAINELLGAGDSSFGVSSEAVRPTLGQRDPSRVFTQTLLGKDFAADGRFLSQGHLNQMDDNLRSLAIDGNFGALNQLDPELAISLMRGLLGEGQANVMNSLSRLRGVINSGGAENPSYQATYANMYPEDAAAGFPRLRRIVGDSGMARLSLHPVGFANTNDDLVA